MPSISTRTFLYTRRSGASSKAVAQSLGKPRAGPARPPQMFGVASSATPSRIKNGPQDETPTAATLACATDALAQLSPIMRRICWASAVLGPTLAVGSTTWPRKPFSSAMLTATLVPPMSTQATGALPAGRRGLSGWIWVMKCKPRVRGC